MVIRRKKKWSIEDNAKHPEIYAEYPKIYAKHPKINTKHPEIYINISTSIQTSGDLPMLLSKDLPTFCPKFIEESKNS